MAHQVDSKNTTAAPVDQARRRLLASAACIAAGTSALSLACPAKALASSEADPIFAAIEHHRRCWEAGDVLYCERVDLEDALTRTGLGAIDREIVRTDAPEWIANNVALDAASDVEQDAELQLASIVPTTLAGVAALPQLAISDHGGCEWGRLEDDAGRARTWEYFVTCNCIKAVENLSAAA
jgi:hypothetical protein